MKSKYYYMILLGQQLDVSSSFFILEGVKGVKEHNVRDTLRNKWQSLSLYFFKNF